MKRICIILLCAALLCSLTACDGITININLNGKETTAPEETTLPAERTPHGNHRLHGSPRRRGLHRSPRRSCHGGSPVGQTGRMLYLRF